MSCWRHHLLTAMVRRMAGRDSLLQDMMSCWRHHLLTAMVLLCTRHFHGSGGDKRNRYWIPVFILTWRWPALAVLGFSHCQWLQWTVVTVSVEHTGRDGDCWRMNDCGKVNDDHHRVNYDCLRVNDDCLRMKNDCSRVRVNAEYSRMNDDCWRMSDDC